MGEGEREEVGEGGGEEEGEGGAHEGILFFLAERRTQLVSLPACCH